MGLHEDFLACHNTEWTYDDFYGGQGKLLMSFFIVSASPSYY